MLTYLAYILGTTVFLILFALGTVGVVMLGDWIEAYKGEGAKIGYYFWLICFFIGNFLYFVHYVRGVL